MHMSDICRQGRVEPDRWVLATVILAEGHVYRKQGSAMLLGCDGRSHGHLSPGCIENDLLERTGMVLQSGCWEIATYDMRPTDDFSWGENVGCGGLLHILLEPVSGLLAKVMTAMEQHLSAGHEVVLTRHFDEAGLGYSISIQADDVKGAAYFAPADNTVTKGQPAWLGRSRPSSSMRERLLARKSQDAVSSGQPFTQLFRPKSRLIILGAGPDAIPVAALADSAHFHVIIADWRGGLLRQEDFPGADLVEGFPAELLPKLNLRHDDYLLIMSHQFHREREFLGLVAGCRLSYLGIMGTRERTARLLQGLPHPGSHLHSPVGLSIGADGPEEIAISIAAELMQTRRELQQKREHSLQSQAL
ncbi:XdhC family protein [Paenibacillus sp. JX-17]|uniref:XdhC family protein n=1 Tax=Paenibacillus lacisoli TaxID=3064525 RepID=A0ABT9C8N2_9BACL|nr:XdhC/CoxI family protein [Paenibacillus sp. JX-17]MDO7905581.1 XdhC family protein [Paenibacillus sp. JX-17]